MSEQNQSQEQTQNAPKKKAWYKKWWVITIGVIILLIIIGSSGDDNSTQSTEQASTSSEKEMKKEVIKETKEIVPGVIVTSATLSKDYDENEVAADEKYKGKIIEISGKITGVDNGILDNELIVKLSDGEYDMSGPWCYMKGSEKEKVIVFKKGQEVTLIGKGDSATIGSPILKECTVK